MPSMGVYVSLSLYLPVLLCTVGYICRYELMSLEAECWACCGEITNRERWQIVATEISSLQKPLQLHRPSTKFALLQEHKLDWGRKSNPCNTLICTSLGLRTAVSVHNTQI